MEGHGSGELSSNRWPLTRSEGRSGAGWEPLQDRRLRRGAAWEEAEEWLVRLAGNGMMTWRGEELCGELVSRSWEVQQGEGRVAPLVAGGDWGAQRWTNLSGPGARGAGDQPPHRRQWDRPRLLCPLCPLQSPVSRSVQPCLLLRGDWVGQPLSHPGPQQTSVINPSLPTSHLEVRGQRSAPDPSGSLN